MPRGHGFILVSFNIFINDLEEGRNSTLIIITSDAKLGSVACTTGRDSKRTRQKREPAWTSTGGGHQSLGGNEAKRQRSCWKQPMGFANKPERGKSSHQEDGIGKLDTSKKGQWRERGTLLEVQAGEGNGC